MKTPLVALLSIFLFAFTCTGDKNENQELDSLEKEALDITREAGLKAEDFDKNLDHLLTLEMAAQVASLPADKAEKKLSSLAITYSWESDRKRIMEIMKGNKMEVAVQNSIELSWVKNTTLEEFKQQHRNPSPEELAKANAAMDKKMVELEAEGKANKDQTAAASKISKDAIASAMFEEVTNLGTYAVFVNVKFMGVPMRDLKVFYRGLSFTISVDLSDDASYNDKKAIEIARMIIDQKLK